MADLNLKKSFAEASPHSEDCELHSVLFEKIRK